MKGFNFVISVLSGIIIAWITGMLIIWVTAYFSLFNVITFIIDIPLAALISGFVTSLLISKDTKPFNIPFFFKEDDTAINRRIQSGIFSSTIFILIYFNVSFVLLLLISSGFRDNILFSIGFYLFGLVAYFFLGMVVGIFGGKAGVAVRDSI